MFLHWVQNSVFEGELTESELLKVEYGLKEIIKEDEDSVTIYTFPSEKIIERRFLGVRKSEPSYFI